MKTILFIATILLVFMANIFFQHDIANLLNKNWRNVQADEKMIPNPLMDEVERLKKQGIKLNVPDRVDFEATNKQPHRNIFDFFDIDDFNDKIDVLFIGDSTISWGFDYQQFEFASGLKAASFSFGLNVPDRHLVTFASLLARCVVDDAGIVILSHSRGMFGAKRKNRKQDRDIKKVAANAHNCADLKNLIKKHSANTAKPGIRDILLDREEYNRLVLDALEEHMHGLIPLWSARIGWQDYFPKKEEAEHGLQSFLRWDPAFRVPLEKKPNRWKYRRLNVDRSKRNWKKMLKHSKRNYAKKTIRKLKSWSEKEIGRTVCHVLPISIRDESYRYWMWSKWTQSRCLLNYAEIVSKQYGIRKLELQKNHHYANTSGLIMASALGKFFKENIETLRNLKGKPAGRKIRSINDEMFIR